MKANHLTEHVQNHRRGDSPAAFTAGLAAATRSV